MPIVIEHDANPAIAGVLAFLSGQGQRAQQQRQQDIDNGLRVAQLQQQWNLAQQQGDRQQTQFDAENQLRRDLANQQATLQREENNQRRTTARNAAALAFLDRQQRDAQAVAAQSQRDQMAAYEAEQRRQQAIIEQQTELAKAQQQQQQQMEMEQMRSNLEQRNKLMQGFAGMVDPEWLAQSQFLTNVNQRALSAPDQYELEKIREGIRKGDPAAINEGLQRRILQFSPEQLTRVRQLREAMAQVDTDPNLSPAQRAQAQRQLAEKLNSIRPMETPAANQPVSLQQQFSQDVPVLTNPVTGEKFMATRDRNGRWQPFETPDIKNKVEQQKHEHQQKVNEQKAAHDIAMETWKTNNSIWQGEKPKPADFADVTTGETDTAAYQKAYQDWLARRPAAPASPGQQTPTLATPSPRNVIQVPDRATLRQMIRSGKVHVGDYVTTPAGPYALTEDDIMQAGG